MENNEIQAMLMAALPLEEVYVMSNDGSHFQVIAVGEFFGKLNRIKKQQAVYAPLMDYIVDKRIHAVSIKTYTPDEWAYFRKFNGL